MATRRICDGCETPLYKVGENPKDNGGVTASIGQELMIEGSRANGMQGGDPLPNGQFHWCGTCARIAFIAVRQQARRAR